MNSKQVLVDIDVVHLMTSSESFRDFVYESLKSFDESSIVTRFTYCSRRNIHIDISIVFNSELEVIFVCFVNKHDFERK